MYKIFRGLIAIIWILDICNFPQVEFLDTTFPINTLCWFLIFTFLPSSE